MRSSSARGTTSPALFEGSGNSLLAGLVDSLLSGLDQEASLRRAIATAVANALVWDAGDIDPAAIRRLEPEVVVEPAAF